VQGGGKRVQRQSNQVCKLCNPIVVYHILLHVPFVMSRPSTSQLYFVKALPTLPVPAKSSNSRIYVDTQHISYMSYYVFSVDMFFLKHVARKTGEHPAGSASSHSRRDGAPRKHADLREDLDEQDHYARRQGIG
jgi:hypothetical protein